MLFNCECIPLRMDTRNYNSCHEKSTVFILQQTLLYCTIFKYEIQIIQFISYVIFIQYTFTLDTNLAASVPSFFKIF